MRTTSASSLKRKSGATGTEGFLARDFHVRLHLGEERGLVETAAQCVALAADEHFRAVLHRIRDMLLDLRPRPPRR
jgi:hypothetical protein